MKAYDQWKYIKGTPAIPEVWKARKRIGRDNNGNEVTVTIPSNEVEVEEAMK